MDKDKAAIALGAAAGIGLTVLLVKKAGAEAVTTVTLYGTVFRSDTYQPLSGITLMFGPYTAITDSQGKYAIENIVPGYYLIQLYNDQGAPCAWREVNLSAGIVELNIGVLPEFVAYDGWAIKGL